MFNFVTVALIFGFMYNEKLVLQPQSSLHLYESVQFLIYNRKKEITTYFFLLSAFRYVSLMLLNFHSLFAVEVIVFTP